MLSEPMLPNTFTVNSIRHEVGNTTPEAIQIHIGEAASSVLLQDNFIRDWNRLYDSCPWASVFQSSSFVNSWYEHYCHKYHPIVVTAFEDGVLVGLLTMAVQKLKFKNGKLFIVHAGHGEADIQTWLALPYHSEWFITGALDKILMEFPKTDILLRHIAPLTPIDWVNRHPAWINRCVTESFSRPIIRMKDFSFSKRERKRVSRLLSMASFEAIPDTQTFIHYLDEIGILYDFRHGGMFNRSPFRDDAAYRNLLIALFDKQLLTVTVLRKEDRVIASIATTVGKNKAHLGAIICHSPMYASYSPGIVLFLLTSQYFAEIGLDYFDLTPGGDFYKDRLATEYDVVQTLVVTNNKRFFIWRNFRNYVQDSLKKVGIDPIAIKLYVGRQRYLIQEKGILQLWQSNRSNTGKAKQLYQVLSGYPLLDSDTLVVNTNALEDLLKYKSEDGDLTRWEFMEAAMRRLESGYTAYTLAESSELHCCVWLKPAQDTAGQASEVNLKNNTTILCDLHISPKSKSKEEPFLISALGLILSNTASTKVFIQLSKRRIYTQIKLKKAELTDLA